MFELLARSFLNVTGFTVVNQVPADIKKFVIVAAPHTSNWDFPFTLAITALIDVDFYWVGKHTLFKKPFGSFMKATGGIPVDRRKSQNLVDQIVEQFQQRERMALAIAAEGTRSKSEYWKTGFYHIAKQADVPIALGFIDYEKKEGGLGPAIYPVGTKQEVLERLRDFYDDKVGMRPELYRPPRFREEAESAD